MFRQHDYPEFISAPQMPAWTPPIHPLTFQDYMQSISIHCQSMQNQVNVLQDSIDRLINSPIGLPFIPYYLPYPVQREEQSHPRDDVEDRAHYRYDSHHRDRNDYRSDRDHQRGQSDYKTYYPPYPVHGEERSHRRDEEDYRPHRHHHRHYSHHRDTNNYRRDRYHERDQSSKRMTRREDESRLADEKNATEKQRKAMTEQQRQDARRLQLENKTKSVPLSQALHANKIYQEYIDEHTPIVREDLPPTTSSSTSSSRESNSSQTILLKKINAYLKMIGGELLSVKGYCNGISLLWLTMMASNTENLFYNIVDQIASCPDENLEELHEIISSFVEWIEIGQHPKRHFGEKCKQHELHKIIGANFVSTREGKQSKKQLEKIIDDLAKPGAMVCIQGWGNLVTNNQEIGHAIGLFNRQGVYQLFDPNCPEGRARDVFRPRLVPEIWNCLYHLPARLKPNDRPYMRVGAAVETYLSQAKVSQIGFFSPPSNQLVTAKTPTPVRSAEASKGMSVH